MRLLSAIAVLAATGVANLAAVQSSSWGVPNQGAARFYMRSNAEDAPNCRTSLDGIGHSSASPLLQIRVPFVDM